MLTGLTKCSSNPAAGVRLRSVSCPQPVTATTAGPTSVQRPDVTCCFDAIHPRHAKIHEDDFRRKLLGDLNGLLAIERRANVVPSLAKNCRERAGRVLVVVHDQDATAGMRR